MAVTHHRYAVDGWGVGEVWLEDGVLLLHDLAGTVPGLTVADSTEDVLSDMSAQVDRGASAPLPRTGGRGAPTGTLARRSSQKSDAFVSDLCRRFGAHLAGTRTRYDDVTLDESGLTGFQRELQHALRAVPWGEVVTYGELAQFAGRPRAARAAGTFCAENGFSLVVPCHRVIASDGIGGYGTSGVALKRRLLALEGVEL